ncbi:hypothetical protein MVEN_01726200 [Mycena venus]|uniref:Uncharacterized protein n=1 Tax=Mycena venus TaxID=2733690 RepID=A0A8H6XM09_9AGAR|nr:hypothetical protein MVEN_01726200 [Mycena venus]
MGSRNTRPKSGGGGTKLNGGGGFAHKRLHGGIGSIGADGGKGEGPELFAPLVETKTVYGINFPETILEKTVEDFCKEYSLGEGICRLLKANSFRKAYTIVFHEDLSQVLGLKVGHVAELKWALADMLLRSELVTGVEIIKKGEYKPDLVGGQGGAGGSGGDKGGSGGMGQANRIAVDQVYRFNSISGGMGGLGGLSAVIAGKNGTGEQTEATTGNRRHVNTTSGILRGGRGGGGAYGTRVGGTGGDGMGARLPIEAVGNFKLIQGGTGGLGGPGGVQGGLGGIGHATEFPKPLCPIDTKTRLRVKNLRLDNKNDLKAKKFRIDDELQRLLVEYGFMTVGGLFHVSDSDLRNIEDTCGKKPFMIGDIAALRGALSGFLRSFPVVGG